MAGTCAKSFIIALGLYRINLARCLKWLLFSKYDVQVVDLEALIGTDEDNIFFVESNNAPAKFHPRLLCAFESAAMHNPNKRVSAQYN